SPTPPASSSPASASPAIRYDGIILFMLEPESRTFTRKVIDIQINGGYVCQIHYSGRVYGQGDRDCLADLFLGRANRERFPYVAIDTSLTFGDERSCYRNQFLGLRVQMLGLRVVDLFVELAIDPSHLGFEHRIRLGLAVAPEALAL